MGVDVGFGNKFLNRVTNRISYNGEVVESCSALLKAVDDGAIIVTSDKCVQQLQGSFSHRMYEYGDIQMMDIGTFKLEGIDRPMPCLQVMPLSICARPGTTMSGCTMTMRGFNLAPGAQPDDDDETAVSLMFCTLGPAKGEGDAKNDEAAEESPAVKLATDIVAVAALAREGYVTKTSNGVSLLAFANPTDGYGFISDVIARLASEEAEGLRFSAGLHTGIPTSVAPNKASGRADYLGPCVNCAARLLSLASETEGFTIGTHAIAVSSSAWMDIANDARSTLEVAGQYQLKGIGDQVEVFKMNC